MAPSQIIALYKRKIGVLILVGFLLSALTFLFLVVTEKNFKASTTYLVVQNQSGQQDYYTLSKSAEYISRILSESVNSELFIDEVIDTGKVNPEFLVFDKKKRLEEWSKTVNVDIKPELGIINIAVKGNSQKEVLSIAQAVSMVITEKNSLFRGENDNISVKILSGPIAEKNPSLSKLGVSILGSFILGILICAAWIYYFKKDDIFFSRALGEKDLDETEYCESLKYLEE